MVGVVVGADAVAGHGRKGVGGSGRSVHWCDRHSRRRGLRGRDHDHGRRLSLCGVVVAFAAAVVVVIGMGAGTVAAVPCRHSCGD